MKKQISILMVFLLFLNLYCFFEIESHAANPESYKLQCTIRDFDPVNSKHPERNHPDFENEKFFDTSATGAVKSVLGADNTPVYAESGYSAKIITSAESFYDWYHDTDKNINIPYEMVFTKSGSMYTFDSASTGGFFPINNKGFGNYYDNKNYHFTLELHAKFIFQRGQVIEVAGDDDVWVFLNKRLVVDLGGIHETQHKTINVDNYINSMNLKPGDICTLDLFFAERHITESNLKISTNIELFNNLKPIADAGDNKTVRTNSKTASVKLDGSRSKDPEGEPLTYIWTDKDGNVIGRGVSPTVDLPVGRNICILTVSDGEHTDTDTVEIEVIYTGESKNRAPIANAGSDQTKIITGTKTTITLDGSKSSDPDGDKLTYRWTDANGARLAVGEKVQIELPVGTHKIKLTVSDGELSDTDTVVITIVKAQTSTPKPTTKATATPTKKVTPTPTKKSTPTPTKKPSSGNTRPVANAGSNKTVVTDAEVAEVTLDGSKSYDPDGDSLSYKWKDESGVTIGNGAKPTVLLPVGKNVLTLTVSDGKLSDSDEVVITVERKEVPGSPTNKKSVDLGVALRANQTKVEEDNEILFTIQYVNKTDVKVYDVEVGFKLSDGMKVVETANGRVSGKNITWDVGDLEPKEKGQIKFKVKADKVQEAEVIKNFIASITSNQVELINTYDDKSKLDIMVYSNRYKKAHTRYILGYPDNTFKGDRNITRAETAVIFARILDLEGKKVKNKSQFVDVPKGFWAEDHIYAVVEAGLFKGIDNNHFKPDVPITRAEFVTVIANYLQISRTKEEVPLEYTFNDIQNHWAQGNIEEVARYNILKGYSDGSFRPQKQITRQEAVTIINRLLHRGPLTNVTGSFPDMPSDHWAFGEVEEAVRSHEYTINEKGEEVMTKFINDPVW